MKGSGFGPQSNTWFLQSTGVLNPNGIAISSAVFTYLLGQLPTYIQRRAHTRPSLQVNASPHQLLDDGQQDGGRCHVARERRKRRSDEDENQNKNCRWQITEHRQ